MMVCSIHALELLHMQVRKYGKESVTTAKLTFGPLGAWFMSSFALGSLLKEKTLRKFSRKFASASTQKLSMMHIPKNWKIWWLSWSSSILNYGLQLLLCASFTGTNGVSPMTRSNSLSRLIYRTYIYQVWILRHSWAKQDYLRLLLRQIATLWRGKVWVETSSTSLRFPTQQKL